MSAATDAGREDVGDAGLPLVAAKDDDSSDEVDGWFDACCDCISSELKKAHSSPRLASDEEEVRGDGDGPPRLGYECDCGGHLLAIVSRSLGGFSDEISLPAGMSLKLVTGGNTLADFPMLDPATTTRLPVGW